MNVAAERSYADWLRHHLVKSGRLKADEAAKTIVNGSSVDGMQHVVDGFGLGHAEQVARALANYMKLPFVELNEDFVLERDEVRLIPESMARRFNLLPLCRGDRDSITVVMADPFDLEAVDTVRSFTRMDIHKAVGVPSRIRSVIDQYYSDTAYLERSLEDLAADETEGVHAVRDEFSADDEQLKIQANDPPVVRFVNLVLMEAVRDGASDVHFEPGDHLATVRIRVDGLLREVTPPPPHLYRAIITRVKILANMDIAERRLPQDGRFKFKVQERSIDIRASVLPEVHGEKVVLRILDRASLKLDMREIGFEEATIRRFHKVLDLPNGIILLTGPTGSGKTTTLYSALVYLRDPTLNIQTVEEPVEYQLEGINQMAIRPAIGLDFANALRSILRQDPDIILVGEIRDLETAEIAMRASLTGHLVLSTLHTNDAPSAFWRLKDIGIPPYLIAATVRLVMAQRLVRCICENCTAPHHPAEDLIQVASVVDPECSRYPYRKGQGCVQCSKTGYSGRSAIVEFLEVSIPVRQQIMESADSTAMKRVATEHGMEPLIHHGLRKVKAGQTTLEEVMSVCPIEDLIMEVR